MYQEREIKLASGAPFLKAEAISFGWNTWKKNIGFFVGLLALRWLLPSGGQLHTAGVSRQARIHRGNCPSHYPRR